MAKSSQGNQRVMRQDLTGYTVTNLEEAWRLAQHLAERQTQVTGYPWTAEVDEYVVGNRPGSELL